MPKASPLFLITPGDPAGIGPEITTKVFSAHGKNALEKKYPGARFVCVGAVEPFKKLRAKTLLVSESELGQFKPKKGYIPILPAPNGLPGFQAGWSIEKATRIIQSGVASAIITGPIHKERLQEGGFRFSGHTDMLADLCGVKDVTMMLANDQLRISLVTVHIGLKDVPKAVTREKVRRAVLHTVDSLKSWWGIKSPRVAVAALNPHGGESGLFGDEEISVITPEISALQSDAKARGYTLVGPLPADTLFANHIMAKPRERYDAVICMYHDQGLIPVKLLDFPRTVNVTLGLPMVRTSVDHGVAFDIVGKNKADPSSLESAIALAVEIIRKKKK